MATGRLVEATCHAESCCALLSLQPARGSSHHATTPTLAVGQLTCLLAHPSFCTWENQSRECGRKDMLG